MAVLLQIDFPAQGPWGSQMSGAYRQLAESIAREPGLVWKIWTERESVGRAGGVYIFDTHENAEAYQQMHTRRLEGFGITGIRAVAFDVNEPLTDITNGPAL